MLHAHALCKLVPQALSTCQPQANALVSTCWETHNMGRDYTSAKVSRQLYLQGFAEGGAQDDFRQPAGKTFQGGQLGGHARPECMPCTPARAPTPLRAPRQRQE